MIRGYIMIRIFLVLIIAVISSPVSAEESTVIRVAGIFDLTGGGAIWGKSERNAFDLACADFKARHPGVGLETKVEDSMFSSRQTVTAFQKLASVDKYRMVVGPTWETTVPMMPLCEARKVVCMAPSYHSKEFYARPWRYNFTAWFDDRGYASTLAARINERGYKRIALFAAITPYYDGLVESLQALSSSKPVVNERVVLEERDFRAMIGRVPRDVDGIVMLLDNAGQIQAFLKQWSELRRDRPDIFTDDLIVYLDPPEEIERYGFTYYYSTPLFNDDRLRQFHDAYKARFGEEPEGASASVAYDETMILLECALKDPGVEAVRACVANTSDYPGFSGTISFAGGQTVRGRGMILKKLGPG